MTNIPAKPQQRRSIQLASRRQFLQQLSVMSLGVGMGILPTISLAADRSVANSVKALTFDVFGTVVDWRGSIIREGQLLAARRGTTWIGRSLLIAGVRAMAPR